MKKRERLSSLLRVVRQLSDRLGDCWYDHHGNCQEHFGEAPCSVKLLRDVLVEFEKNGNDEDD